MDHEGLREQLMSCIDTLLTRLISQEENEINMNDEHRPAGDNYARRSKDTSVRGERCHRPIEQQTTGEEMCAARGHHHDEIHSNF